jgi:hypothetical protein
MRHVGAGLTCAPGNGVDLVGLGETHEFVIGGMIVDFIDAVTEAIKAAKLGHMAVSSPGKIGDALAAYGSAESLKLSGGPGAALAGYGGVQNRITFKEVKISQRRRLVGYLVAVENCNGQAWGHDFPCRRFARNRPASAKIGQ